MLLEIKRVRIHQILPVEERKWNDKTFKTQQVWVEIEKYDEYREKSKYSNFACFEAKFDKVFEAISQFHEGQYVNISFALEGNLSKNPDKPGCFNKLTLVKIEPYTAGSGASSTFSAPAAPSVPSAPAPIAKPTAAPVDEFDDNTDDLPFD